MFLPRYTINDELLDEEIASFFGPNAKKWAMEFIAAREFERGRYGLSVSDDGCKACGQMFSSEAWVPDDNDDNVWFCPYCETEGNREAS